MRPKFNIMGYLQKRKVLLKTNMIQNLERTIPKVAHVGCSMMLEDNFTSAESTK